jgi:hypothetical protein
MQLILVCRAHRLFLFAKKAGDSAVNGDGKIQDFAELWVGANRSRALILMQYIPDRGYSAVEARWEGVAQSGTDTATHTTRRGDCRKGRAFKPHVTATKGYQGKPEFRRDRLVLMAVRI